MQEIYEALSRDRDLMKTASRELRDRGIEKAMAEAEYQTVKNRRVLELKAEGFSASMIQMTIKGDDKVNDKLFARDCADVLYESAREALNVYKLDARLLEAQISREWNQNNQM